MKKSLSLIVFTLIIGYSVIASDSEVLFQEYVTTTDNNRHDIEIVRIYDDFEDTELFLISDYIGVTGYVGLLKIGLSFGFNFSNYINPLVLMVNLQSRDWYFLTGEIALKFPSTFVRLKGKSDSKILGSQSLQTSIIITQQLTDISYNISAHSQDDVNLRIYTKEKGNIDISIPAIFFQKAFSFSKDEADRLKAKR
jgi:hypothetical protein